VTLRREALTGVTWTALGTAGVLAAQMIQLVVLARLLQPADFGLMGMVLIVLGFTQAYADVGISGALVHHRDVSREELSSLYWLNVFFGALVGVLLWLNAPVVAGLFHEERVVPLLRVVSAAFLILPLGKQFEVLLQRDLRFDVLARQDIVAAATSLVLAITAAMLGAGVWSLVLGTMATIVTRTALLLVAGLRAHRPALHFRWTDLERFLAFGAYQMGERTINYIADRLDQFVIGSLLGAVPLGLYSFAYNLTAQPVGRLNPIVTKVAFPIFCRVQDDPDRLRRGYMSIVKLVTSVNAPLLLGLVAVAPRLLPSLFGPQWTASVVLVQVLSLVALYRTMGNPVGSLLLAKGRADLGFKWNTGRLLLSVPVVWAGARAGGALGVAVSILLLQAVLAPISYFLLVRPIVGPSARDYLLAVMRPTGLALLMAALVAALAGVVRVPVTTPLLMAQVLAGGAVYALLLWRFEPETIHDLRTAVLRRA
jgi:lipopolysaccharide exporter